MDLSHIISIVVDTIPQSHTHPSYFWSKYFSISSRFNSFFIFSPFFFYLFRFPSTIDLKVCHRVSGAIVYVFDSAPYDRDFSFLSHICAKTQGLFFCSNFGVPPLALYIGKKESCVRGFREETIGRFFAITIQSSTMPIYCFFVTFFSLFHIVIRSGGIIKVKNEKISGDG